VDDRRVSGFSRWGGYAPVIGVLPLGGSLESSPVKEWKGRSNSWKPGREPKNKVFRAEGRKDYTKSLQKGDISSPGISGWLPPRNPTTVRGKTQLIVESIPLAAPEGVEKKTWGKNVRFFASCLRPVVMKLNFWDRKTRKKRVNPSLKIRFGKKKPAWSQRRWNHKGIKLGGGGEKWLALKRDCSRERKKSSRHKKEQHYIRLESMGVVSEKAVRGLLKEEAL